MNTFGYDLLFFYKKDDIVYFTTNPNLALKRKEQGYEVKRYVNCEEGIYIWKWHHGVPFSY